MAPLKSLEQRYPIIDSNFQGFCASHGIFSEDFLLHDMHALVVSAEQHNTSARLKQGINQVLASIDALHQPWLNGMELLEDVLQRKNILSTGCQCIDDFLNGGLRDGHLIELVGPSSSGKTQVCFMIASNVARSSGRVVFLDTCNSFSPKRVAEVVSQMSDNSTSKAKKSLEHVMSNIVCYSVFDIFTMFDVVHHLKSTMRSQSGCRARMLIIDSISSLITPILGGSGAHGGRALMASAGFILKQLANEHNLPVLVTNHMVAGEAGLLKPALGESWKSIPHIRLLLSRDSARHISSISVLKHPNMATGDRVEFQIL
ncbi:PREDICTED: DNA repair protein RAD51 homolog 4 isoform X2 [Ipomoea nil]|uniref:DNA repair protein RAD51 homolog 4 isoform X2 n=2 Tax=Ipomoea nil TaxID=35883 RepID=UPI000900F623|nr:PREDICTED: DNA repair protein RAD51 homolog 4 isoform X2 [Ipomoea nil]